MIGGLIALIGGYLIDKSNSNQRNEIVNGMHRFVFGQFMRVGSVGDGSSRFVEVSYNVDGKIYYRTTSSDYYFDLCMQNKSCSNKKFWVMYLVKDPEKSLVDISKEIQNVENPQIPINFENFK